MNITSIISTIIPLASFLSLALALALFVKNKANVDALKESVETFRKLADAYKCEVDKLNQEVSSQRLEIERLKGMIEAERLATRRSVDEIIAGFKRYGYCPYSAECPIIHEINRTDRNDAE